MAAALDHETERDHYPLTVLQAVSLSVCRAPEIAVALNMVLDQLLELTGAETGAIHVTEDGTGDLRLAARRGLSEHFWQRECRIPNGACLCGGSASGDEPLVVNDLLNDPRLERPACLDERIGALVAVPFRSRGRSFGLLTLYARAPGAFAGVDRMLLHAIGLHLGAAIDNALWGAAMRESAIADERHVIASELHDGVAQSLAYLNLQVRRVQDLLDRGASASAIRELEGVRAAIQHASEDVRHLLADFRIAPTGPGSFAAALQKQLTQFEARTGISVESKGADEAATLSFVQQAEVFRIIQEALANVRKHAGATVVTVTCERAEGWCRVRVADNGTGFDPARLDDGGGLHAGTSIIRERAARLQGHVAIESQPGQGTVVTVAVPLLPVHERSRA
jgi:two-component system nitrate/nitrite sensor histidine kinase NarX